MIRVIPTEAARPTSDTVRTDGLVAAVVVPVLDAQGQVQAVLYGGDLLSQHYGIVDTIKQQVFRDEVYQGKQIGAVTIFLGDLRISTTFQTDGRRPGVGTQFSAPCARTCWTAAASGPHRHSSSTIGTLSRMSRSATRLAGLWGAGRGPAAGPFSISGT